MDSSDENETACCATPPEITGIANEATKNLLPLKSKDKYLLVYKNFNHWRQEKNISSFSENVLLAYFSELSTKLKPSSLWAHYSMLKSTINLNNSINIGHYAKLTSFLKRQSNGYECKKSKVLTSPQIEKFLNEAPDDKFLATKVRFIIQSLCECICKFIDTIATFSLCCMSRDMKVIHRLITYRFRLLWFSVLLALVAKMN